VVATNAYTHSGDGFRLGGEPRRAINSGAEPEAANLARGVVGIAVPSWFIRLAGCVILYALYVGVASICVVPVLDQLDQHLPGLFFYHLEEGESGGPIGNPMRLLTGLWLQAMLFWLVFAPALMALRMRPSTLVALTVLNVPIVMAAMPH